MPGGWAEFERIPGNSQALARQRDELLAEVDVTKAPG
jgi:hypothetical protein